MPLLLSEATRDVPIFSMNGKVIPAKVVDCYDGNALTVGALYNNNYSGLVSVYNWQ